MAKLHANRSRTVHYNQLGDVTVLEILRRLIQAVFGVGLFEFLRRIGWKWAATVIVAIVVLVGAVLLGIALLIGLLL